MIKLSHNYENHLQIHNYPLLACQFTPYFPCDPLLTHTYVTCKQWAIIELIGPHARSGSHGYIFANPGFHQILLQSCIVYLFGKIFIHGSRYLFFTKFIVWAPKPFLNIFPMHPIFIQILEDAWEDEENQMGAFSILIILFLEFFYL